MAFAATMQWDVRTTGSDSNGGGFDPTSGTPGTDYSQQDSPQVTYTDLVIDGTTNTKCTSAGNPFTSAHVGNIINITSGTGFTVQRVQIMSVTAAVATCDKSLGTLSSTGGNGKLGGSLATIGAVLSSNTSSTLWVAGNTVHVKSGTYTITSTIPVYTGATPLIIKGYSLTHGDGGTRPVITTATNSVSLFSHAAGSGRIIYINLSMTNTAAGTKGHGIIQTAGGVYSTCYLIDCVIDGMNIGIYGDNSTTFPMAWVIVVRSQIKNCVSHGIYDFGGLTMVASSVLSCGGDGIKMIGNFSGSNINIVYSIIYGNTGVGVNGGSTSQNMALRLHSNSISNNGGSGVALNTLFYAVVADSSIVNNIIYGNGGYGVDAGTSGGDQTAKYAAVRTNAMGSNVSGNWHNIDPTSNILGAYDNTVTLTASPFVNAAGGDFSLNNTAGGGLVCKNAGLQWS